MSVDIIFFDGFERGSNSKWTKVGSGGTVTDEISAGMTGTYAASIGATTGLYKTLDSVYPELYISMKVNFNNSGGTHICQFKDSAGTSILTLRRNASTSFLEVHLGNYAGTVIATSTTLMSYMSSYLVEIYYKASLTAAGVVQVKINEVLDINFAGVTTVGLADDIKTFQIGYDGATNLNNNYDDIVIATGGWLGNRLCTYHPVLAESSVVDWAVSAGTSVSCLNEVVADNADYIYTDVIDALATFTHTPARSIVSSIDAVQIVCNAASEDTPTPTKLRLIADSGDIETESADIATTSTTTTYYSSIIQDNPDTGEAFTEDEFNSLIIGVKAVA